MERPWHTLSVEDVLVKLDTSPQGLSSEEVKKRIQECGLNKLPEGKSDSLFTIFLRQFKSPLIYLLFGSALILFLMGDQSDAYIILFVLLFNAVIGAVQEGRAQNTLRALRRFSQTKAIVVRDGREEIVADEEVVVGDVLVLREGVKVPADARIIISRGLQADESSLTGESEPVVKSGEVLRADAVPAAEQKNMIFKGSVIPLGNGQAVVVATGAQTMLGSIAQKIVSIDTDVPLKIAIEKLSRNIIYVVVVMTVFLFALGIFTGNSPRTMFAVGISLAVSVIPEGLPIVLTLVLATGVWRMGKRNVLVKKLQAVEALGTATYIAVDKTGTITRNELTTEVIYAQGRTFTLGGAGYEPKGDIMFEGKVVDAANHPELLFAGKVAALSAAAEVMYQQEEKRWSISGDPTEAAILVAGEKIGFKKDDLEGESPLLFELSFDYARKFRATLNKDGEDNLLSVVGAPEVILSLCADCDSEALQAEFEKLSHKGLRVIAFATARTTDTTISVESMPPLTFGGFFGMRDAIRPEAKEAVRRAMHAGIQVVMITGDHVKTAVAIAREVGIAKEGDKVLTGKEIEGYSDEELSKHLEGVSVFARVTPDHKMRIIAAYRLRGEVVAMTGDGVNDAPPLVAADLGVAMGNVGTEVAKEAADIVLLDDNFGSIVAGVEEGRNMYRSIKKVLLYLFSTSIAEAIVVIAALAAGYPLPLTAAQIIWLNFVTDTFLVAALAMEPKEKGLLSESFKGNKLVDRSLLIRMFILGLPMALGTLYVFAGYYTTDLAKAMTMAVTVLAVFQWVNAWNCRSETRSLFALRPFGNLYLVAATVLVVLLQLAAVYWAPLQLLLSTTPLTLSEWGICIAVGFTILLVDEARKLLGAGMRALRKPVLVPAAA